ncbi:hypothetical protein ABIE40_005728 [Rhizobium sp. OAE497]
MRGLEFWVALHNSLFLGHLVQILVLENPNDEAVIGPVLPVFGNGDQLRHVIHLCAIADQTDDRPVRMGIFSSDGTAAPIDASPPESDAVMPALILISRAYQFAQELESLQFLSNELLSYVKQKRNAGNN